MAIAYVYIGKSPNSQRVNLLPWYVKMTVISQMTSHVVPICRPLYCNLVIYSAGHDSLDPNKHGILV